jgi:hypothetical protein
MTRTLPVLLIAVCMACTVTHGVKVDTTLVTQLEVRVATQADAIKLLGTPTMTSDSGDGKTLLMWSHVTASALSHGESSRVALVFGADGKLLRKTVTAAKI